MPHPTLVTPHFTHSDGNVLDGDGCSSTCQFQDFPPPSISPSPPPPPPTNSHSVDYCLAAGLAGCATCAGKCPTVGGAWWGHLCATLQPGASCRCLCVISTWAAPCKCRST